MSMANGRTERNIEVELLRIISIIAIMILHFQEDFVGKRIVFSGGYLGVDVFFLLSGFFIFQRFISSSENQLPKSVYKHARNRFFQLWPPYAMVILIWQFLLFVQNNFDISFLFHHIWGTKYQWLFLHFIDGVSGFEFRTLWFLPILFWSELLIVYLLNINWKSFVAIAPLISVVTMAFISHEFGNLSMQGDWTGLVIGGFLRSIAEMSLGCFAAYLTVQYMDSRVVGDIFHKSFSPWIWGGVKIICYLFMIIIMAVCGFDNSDFWFLVNALICLILCWIKPFKYKVGIGNIILFFSKHVYWVFLTHLLVLKILTDYFNSISVSVSFVIYIIFSFLVSIILSKAYDFMKKKVIRL